MRQPFVRVAALVIVLAVGSPLLTYAAHDGGTEGTRYLLSHGTAGFVHIGMPIDDLMKHEQVERVVLTDLQNEGHFSPALKVFVRGADQEPALIIEIEYYTCSRFSASRISVLDPAFRTAEGLGVGSTWAEVQTHYPGPLGWGYIGKGRIVEELGIGFWFHTDGEVSEETRVDSVFMVLNPLEIRRKWCPPGQR